MRTPSHPQALLWVGFVMSVRARSKSESEFPRPSDIACQHQIVSVSIREIVLNAIHLGLLVTGAWQKLIYFLS